jgi:hypothetical protein
MASITSFKKAILICLAIIYSLKCFPQLPEVPEELRGKWVGTISVFDSLHHREGSAMVSMKNFGYKVDGKIEVDWHFKNEKIRLPGFPVPTFGSDTAGFTTVRFEGELAIREHLTKGTFFLTHAYYNNVPFITGSFLSQHPQLQNTHVFIQLLPNDYVSKASKQDKNFKYPIKMSVLNAFYVKNNAALRGEVKKVTQAIQADKPAARPGESETSINKTTTSKNNEFSIDRSHKPHEYALLDLTPNNQLALLGKYSIGTNVTILNNKTGESFLCKTTSVKKFSNELEGDAILTTLDKVISVRSPDQHLFTAILSADRATFELVDRRLVEDMVLTLKIDKVIKQQGYLKQLLSQYDEAKFASGYLESLASKIPVIHHLNIPGVDINVITYKFNEYEIGPRFLEINSKIMPLSGQCCFLDFQVFKYGRNYFIKSNSGQCESGYIVAEIFEMRDNALIKEFSDGGYSN